MKSLSWSLLLLFRLSESFQLMHPKHRTTQIHTAPRPFLQASVDDPAARALSPMETWYATELKSVYEQALTIRCPFFRRRVADILDNLDMVIRFLIIRHKSLEPPGWRCKGDTTVKQKHLSKTDLMKVIRKDWKTETNRGYYITGKVTTSVYRDDALFDGPDPDMPVRGLRKYLNESSAELISLDVIQDTVVAKWRMQGVLRLPWRPRVPQWTGTTTYFTDEDGLIVRHEETWDKSVLQAFLQTLWPECAALFWNTPHDE